MRIARLWGLLGSTIVLAHCAAEPELDPATATLTSAVCAAEWQPTWQQTAGANEWWMELTIGGAEVASAHVDLPGGGRLELARQWNKWMGKPPAKIARGAAIVVHATTTDGRSAQTKPFAYLDVTTPETDACAPAGGTCSDAFRPSFQQAGGANEWWVEYAIAASVAVTAARLELPGGATVTLANEFGKWRGKPGARVPAGTMVTLHATANGSTAKSEPFPYLTQTAPALVPCTPPGDGTCSPSFTPSWSEGAGANEWWVEYAISGSIASARLDIAGGGSVTLTAGAGKWRGKPTARLVRGSSVTLRAQNAAGEAASTQPFGYLVDKGPTTTPCSPPTGDVITADVGGTNTGYDPFVPATVLHDAVNDKVLLLGSVYDRPNLHRCNSDGTSCTSHDLDAGFGVGAGTAAAALVEPQSRKLLFASFVDPAHGTSYETTEVLSVFRCELDGTACVRHEVPSVTRKAPYGSLPSLALDAANGKVVVGTCSDQGATLIRCGLDGTSCAATVTTAGPKVCAGYQAAVVVDDIAGKIDFAYRNDAAETPRLQLTQCNLQASGCQTSTLPTPPPGFSNVSAVQDPATRTLAFTVPTNQADGGPLTTISCRPDATSCTSREIGYGGPELQSLAIGGELVVANAGFGPAGPRLYRCSPTGENCTSTTLSLDRFWRGYGSSLGYDATRNTFLVGTAFTIDDGAGPYEVAPLLLRAPRSGAAHSQHDVSAGPGASAFAGYYSPTRETAYVDEANRRLLVLGAQDDIGLTPSRRLRRPLSRCNLDGSACTVVETGTAERILGITGGHLYMLGVWRGDTYYSTPNETSVIELLRCNVDGTDCTRTDVVRPLVHASSLTPFAALDVERGVAVIAIPSDQLGREHAVYRCPLDGAPCLAPVTLDPPSVINSLTVDAARDVLLFTNRSGHLVRCQPDGTGCTERPIDTADPYIDYAVHIDASGLVLVGPRADLGPPVVITCRPDGTGCVRRDLAVGGSPSLLGFATRLDRGRLYVATDDEARDRKATAYACARDGSSCTTFDLSAGRPSSSSASPTILIDHASNRLDIVGADHTLYGRARLFSIDLPLPYRPVEP